VLERGVRGVKLAWAALAGVLASSCGDASEPVEPVAVRYLRDRAFRRDELVSSLTTRDNDYARLRLARYETGDARDWALLPAWNPPVSPVRESNLTGPATDLRALTLSPAATAGDLSALRELGESAFWRYPAMLVSPSAEPTLTTRAAFDRYGLKLAEEGRPGGDLVRVAFADGSAGLAYTCAACHSVRNSGGVIVAGLANARFDLGALSAASNDTIDPAVVTRLRAWGPGRVDVTTDDGREPVAIPDLRPLRFQAYLQRAGAVRQRSLATLAVRIETLLITSHHEAVRPPREVALGLALYLYSLGDALASRPVASGRGAEVFAATCARCHALPTYAGGIVAAEVVGTDPALARSATRGTGGYRVSSLRGVGERVRLMHDASIAGLDSLLDRARASGGHPFGVDLGAQDREALKDYLRSL
jgi:mono/diheme cytochrome c family protein